MALRVVVGGQFGSEGKGKLVAHLALTAGSAEAAVVRCGGANSGHTVDDGHDQIVLRQLPSGVVNPQCMLCLGAGMVIDTDLLLNEMRRFSVRPARLRIDRNAILLQPGDRVRESRESLRERVGSTLSGTGSAVARKVLREPDVRTASSDPLLQNMCMNVSEYLNSLIDSGGTVIVEGTQGTGLSLHHSPYFPFATSRDTTASGFLSEVGLSPLLVTELFVVLRTYPIRVPGNSGPVRGEISWEEISRRSGAPDLLTEQTSVTHRTRRVGEFDWDRARDAVVLNRPTALAVHGLDYLNFEDRGIREPSALSQESQTFVAALEERLGVAVALGFTGPMVGDIVDFRLSKPAGPEVRREKERVYV